jgi:hypothetical protein
MTAPSSASRRYAPAKTRLERTFDEACCRAEAVGLPKGPCVASRLCALEVFRLSDFSRGEFLDMMTKGNHTYSEATTQVNV